jgi:hypothetical protein
MISMLIMGYWLGNVPIAFMLANGASSYLSPTNSTGNSTTSTNIASTGTWENHPNMVFDTIFFWILVLAGIIGLASLISQGVGFASFYIFPAIILYAMFNFLIFPFSFLMDTSMPDTIKLPLILLYNGLLSLCIYTAVRGGS